MRQRLVVAQSAVSHSRGEAQHGKQAGDRIR